MSRTRQRAEVWRPAEGRGSVRTLAYDYASGHRVARHVHDLHQFVYAVRGVMTVSSDDGAWIVPPHRGVWVPARVEHEIAMSGAVSMRTVYLDPRVAADLPRECRVVDVPPLLRELILHAVALGSLDRRVPEEARLLAVLLDQLRALPARVRALHLPQPTDPRVRRLVEKLESDPSDRRALAALARGTGASARTLQRLFRAETGMSFQVWRRQRRLRHALERLASGASVTAVALEAGYQSVSAFVSVFRRTFGQTPGRYFRAPSTLA